MAKIPAQGATDRDQGADQGDAPRDDPGDDLGGGAGRDRVIDPGGGANQRRVRAYNERLVLSLVRRHESLPKSEIARRSGLSAQAVTVIMRGLEADGLLIRGAPRRGRVGQPSIPMSLNPDGAYSFGLKIGRRSADLVLMDFVGRTRAARREIYPHPRPERILRFAARGVAELSAALSADGRRRISGVGVAMPFELWNWSEMFDCDPGDLEIWRGFDMETELARVCAAPIFIQNDATAACGAELVFGRGAQYSDFCYFFVGAFVGGGLALNQSLYVGRSRNAGALGSLPIPQAGGRPEQLVKLASIHVLEQMMTARGADPSALWLTPDAWPETLPGFDALLDDWIAATARNLALAAVAASAVIDFEAVVIDGAFPAQVRARIVAAAAAEAARLDTQGIAPPRIVAGQVGAGARAIGAASLPLFARHLLDQSVLFKETAPPG